MSVISELSELAVQRMQLINHKSTGYVERLEVCVCVCVYTTAVLLWAWQPQQ